ncbi:MAG TPA: DUF402 domain-containing protein [Bacilli bacterium]|nr:DUF402 domain-containing protein [Bacilli bacterium]
MEKIKVGDKLTIHCYKHNGKIHRTGDEATVLEINEEMLVCADFRTKVTEADGKSYKTRGAAVMFFYRDKWFNIIGQFKKKGLYYYCNLATPFLIDGKTIKYIDYDLDLRVFPDGGFKVFDRNEYNYHKKLMKYPDEIDRIVKEELNNLIDMKKKNIGPFQKGVVQKYYEIYENIVAEQS